MGLRPALIASDATDPDGRGLLTAPPPLHNLTSVKVDVGLNGSAQDTANSDDLGLPLQAIGYSPLKELHKANQY